MRDGTRVKRTSGYVTFLLLLHAAPVLAQSSALETVFLTGPEAEPLPLPRLAGPIDIDGRPDERAWQDVPALPLTMYSPVFRGEPTQRTEIRVAYDDDYLYAAGWFYDTEPDGIRINSLYRDRWAGDDAFALYIDAFNDKRNAKWFGTTPAGMRFDLLVSDDGATTNGSWDTFWDARATVTNEGWFAEVRIPFSSLGFQDRDDRAVMGLTATRAISRLNERVTFPAIDPRYGFRQPSVAREVVVEGVRSGLPIYATPYVLTGVSQTPLLPAGETRFRTERELRRDAGLDLRFAPSSELTLDITANTDFAQVEADDEQVNLDRFSLFFPEKRRFFQERSELFDFNMGSEGGRLFHSRQIGLVDGVPTPVLGGARLVGRAGDWDIALLDMQTANSDAGPGENFAVARLRRSVFGPGSTVGGMLTRRAGGGRQNLAVGLDGVFRLPADHYLTARLAATHDRDNSEPATLVDRSQVFVNWSRPVARGLGYEVSGSRSARMFNPAMGFQPRQDFTTLNAVANWYLFTDRHRTFRRVIPGALAFSTWRNGDGALESGQYAVWLQWDTKEGGGGWIEPKLFVEDVASDFSIGGDAVIPRGRYTFADLQLVWHMPTGKRLRTNLDARAGSYFDGNRAQLILTPTWNISPQIELEGGYQYTRLRFPTRNDGADIHLTRLRVRGALDARASANAFVQYNSTTGRLALNVRLRYSFSEGTDVWVVYDDRLDVERAADLDGIRPPLSTGRALVVKYTHTLALRTPGGS